MGVELKMMIADPLDDDLWRVIRTIASGQADDPVQALYLKISNRIAATEEPAFEDVDSNDPEQVKIWKTVQILLNKVIYADSYLEQ
jgi:hypothetical protein